MLLGACSSGHKELALQIIQKIESSEMSVDWDSAVKYACSGGNKEIALLMLERGTKNWNLGLEISCGYDHDELVLLMIERGATECRSCYRSIEEHKVESKLYMERLADHN
jgi:hypothetical protein